MAGVVLGLAATATVTVDLAIGIGVLALSAGFTIGYVISNGDEATFSGAINAALTPEEFGASKLGDVWEFVEHFFP